MLPVAYRSRMEQLTQTLQPRNEELGETATGRPQGSRAEFCACPRGCIMQLGRFDDTYCDFCWCDTDGWPCPCDCGHGCPCHPCFPNLDLQGDDEQPRPVDANVSQIWSLRIYDNQNRGRNGQRGPGRV